MSLPAETSIVLSLLIFFAALLYSSVGHAGASGYLAAMALCGLAPDVMKPTALALNIMVSMVASYKFCRAGCFSWRIFLPFALFAMPLAFVGGMIDLPNLYYKPIVGLILLYSATRLVMRTDYHGEISPPPLSRAIVAGGLIGFLSGLTGVGGGIFLSPLLLLMGWSRPRETSAVAAVFILVNSIAGLCGHYSSISHIPTEIALWAPCALVGGWLGSKYGSERMPSLWITRLLALVLVVAGLKMILFI